MKKAILITMLPELDDKIRRIEGWVDEIRDKLYLTKYKTKAYISVREDDEVEALQNKGKI